MNRYLQLRTFFPKGLWGRSVLIVLTPIFLIQVLSGYIFFGRHWEPMTARFADSMVHRLAAGIYLFETAPLSPEEKVHLIRQKLGLRVQPLPPSDMRKSSGYHVFQSRFERALNRMMKKPYAMRMKSRLTYVWVKLENQVLCFHFPTKWIISKTSLWWLMWSLGSSIFFALLAAFFLRRQLVPLRHMADFARRLSRGQKVSPYVVRGAREFRQIGHTLKKTYKELVDKNKEQSSMLIGLSHDLRTPLARMKLQLAMMKKDHPAYASLNEDIAQMDQMVESYMTFVRTGELEAPTRVNVLGLVFRVLKRLDAQQKKKVSVLIPKGYHLRVSGGALERCLQNLVKNALHYADQKIVCTVYETNDALCFVIEDDGPGVSKEAYEEIFKPFVRLEGARALNEASTGLGLSIVRHFVQNMGGYVSADASDLGGLRVTIALPLQKAAA